MRNLPGFLLSFFSFLLMTIALSQSSHATQASALAANPFAMTMTQALALPSTDESISGRVNILGRGPTPLLEDRDDVRYNAMIQVNRAAPLVFVLPGTGGLASSPGALFIAEKLFQQGYHAITLDNPFSWAFTVSSSRSGLPGYTPADAQDLYLVMQKVREKIVRENRLAPRSYSLVGYSLGALQSVFVKKIDDSIRSFRFDKAFLINPPLDLVYGMDVLDSYYARGMRLSENRRNQVMGRIYSVGEKYLMGDKKIDFANAQFVEGAFRELGLRTEDMVFVIGQTFRHSLRDVIFASQQVHDRGILKSEVSKHRRNARMAEAQTFSFRRYAELFIMPNLKTQNGVGRSLEALNSKSSLYQFGDYISSQPGLFVIHSQDDFILKPGDTEWLKEKFGARAAILPYGGHCGLLNFPQFTAAIKKVFPQAR